MTTLEDLEALIGPPSKPPPPVNWEQIERQAGVAFPDDYKRFAARYPALIIGDFLHVSHPTTGAVLRTQLSRYLDVLRELREADPDDVPYPVFPDEGGLYPWGSTDNGDWLCWLTSGPPNTWPIVAIGRPGQASYTGTMTDFLVAVLSRQLKFELFPSDFPTGKVAIYEYE